MLFNELDEYVYKYIKNKIDNNDKTINHDIFNIIKMRHLDGFDRYSREMLSLALKKRMVITIENYMLKNNNSLIEKENYEDFLCSYIDLFLREFHQPIKKEHFMEVYKQYDSRLIEAEYKLANKPLILPNGEVIIVEDIIIAIEEFLEKHKIDSYKLKEIKYRLKKVAILSALVSALTILAVNDEKEPEIIEITETDTNDFQTENIIK